MAKMFNKSFKRHNVGGTGYTDTRFSETVHNNVRKSVFNRDQVHKTTFNAGKLIPFYIDEVLPGDTFSVDLAYLTRMSTPIFPTMDDVELDFYFFFVPNRIVWRNWQRLNGENDLSAFVPSSEPALVPVVTGNNTVPLNSIGDYYGLPNGLNFNSMLISALPFRGYAAIYNRWFRDQNFQAPVAINLDNTSDGETFAYNPYNLVFDVNKKHDYFTSALPNRTKGVTTSTPLRSISWISGTVSFPTNEGALANQILQTPGVTGGPASSYADNMVQALRSAFQLNKLLERDMRSGTRYIEMLKAHFNVEAEDYRLQYPEFLGSHSTIVGMSQVPQTSSTDATSPQGNLAAFSMTSGASKIFTKSFVEHGYVHGLVCARQRKTYQEGIERFFFRRDRFDFYYPELAHLQDQPILEREIYALGPSTTWSNVFGFQEIWADYKYKPNRVSGQFRSDAFNSLDAWHYADHYSAPVYMSDAWIRDNSQQNIARTLAVDPEFYVNQIIADIKIINRSTREMPVHSSPGLADHF